MIYKGGTAPGLLQQTSKETPLKRNNLIVEESKEEGVNLGKKTEGSTEQRMERTLLY